MTDLNAKIKKLEDWQTRQPLLSLCIGKEGTEAPSRADLLTQFHSLIHTNLFAPQEKIFREGLEKFEKYLNESFDPHSIRSVAFFTDGKGWWEVVEMEFFIEPFCLVGTTPYLESIKKALNKHDRYLVLLVDREKARLFTVNQGLIEDKLEFSDVYVPQRVRAKKEFSGRTTKIARHIEADLHQHLAAVAVATNNFVKGKKINFVIVGGHQDLIPKMKKELLYPLDRLVKAEMITALNIPLNDSFLKSKEIAAKINPG